MTAFQTQVNVVQAPAVEGDFCDTNPRWTVDAGQFGMVAGPNGAVVARFCWATPPNDNDDTPTLVSTSGFGPVTGFIHREQQGLNTTYLADAGNLIQKGFPVTVHSGGGFWVKNAGTNEALWGMKAYANYAGGAVTFAPTGQPTSGGSGSTSTVTAQTFSVTGTILNGVLTVTAVGSGSVYPGAQITGTGIDSTGVFIVSQLSGTAQGVGTYLINTDSLVVSTAETISGTYGLLTVAGTVVSGFAVNQLINGTNVAANTYITALVSGTGGAGTYVVNNNTAVSSTAITSYVNVETKWVAMSGGIAGTLVKISSHVLG